MVFSWQPSDVSMVLNRASIFAMCSAGVSEVEPFPTIVSK